jgi:hypothetical protein
MSIYRDKESLSPNHRRLLELLQKVNFGRLESIRFQNGEPLFEPNPIVVREHKFASENGARPEIHASNFQLKQQVVELFEYFDEIRNGVVDVLEVKYGLPFRMLVTEGCA